MGLFNNMLKDSESLFLDTVALDYDFIPKLIPYREKEQHIIANSIKPLFQKRNARNLMLYGLPGVGKTVATKHVLKELEDETDEIIPIYINCWTHNSSYKIISQICDLLGYKFIQNKKTNELFNIIKDKVNKVGVVFCFDEIDKLDDFDFLYFILENIYRSCIILISNYKSYLNNLDSRLKSRLTGEFLEFKSYDEKQTVEILRNRLKYAFVDNVWEDSAFNLIAEKTWLMQDIRSGLYLLRESGNFAEEMSSRKITIDHVKSAVKKLDEFSIKNKKDLVDNTKFILDIVKESPNTRIGSLYKIYEDKGGDLSYKSFTRHIDKLEKGNFIKVDKQQGYGGATKIISFKEKEKKLSEF